MGRKDGESIAPTVIGIPTPSVNALATTRERTGTPLPRSSATAIIAAIVEKTKIEPNIERPSHTAKVGRERGNESPMPVGPARAALAGRIAPSPKLWTPISAVVIPAAAPTIPY